MEKKRDGIEMGLIGNDFCLQAVLGLEEIVAWLQRAVDRCGKEQLQVVSAAQRRP
jgi:hypothetical protein